MTRFLFSCALMVAFFLFVGCDAKPASKPAADEHHEGDGHDHSTGAHPETGPHQGQLVELGNEEYHAEVVHNEATHTVSIYLLDKSAKTSVSIADAELTINLIADGKPAQFKLPAARLAEDPDGKSSCFVLVDERLCEAMDAPDSKPRLNVTIEGKPYSGTLDHHEHGEHEHGKQ